RRVLFRSSPRSVFGMSSASRPGSGWSCSGGVMSGKRSTGFWNVSWSLICLHPHAVSVFFSMCAAVSGRAHPGGHDTTERSRPTTGVTRSSEDWYQPVRFFFPEDFDDDFDDFPEVFDDDPELFDEDFDVDFPEDFLPFFDRLLSTDFRSASIRSMTSPEGSSPSSPSPKASSTSKDSP